jgi:hypothetical protein
MTAMAVVALGSLAASQVTSSELTRGNGKEAPIVVASLIVLPASDLADASEVDIQDLGLARSLSVGTIEMPPARLKPIREEAEIVSPAQSTTLRREGREMARLFESESYEDYAEQFNLAAIPIPTPRPEARLSRSGSGNLPAVTTRSRPQVAREQKTMRPPAEVTTARAEEPVRKRRIREGGPIFFGIYR